MAIESLNGVSPTSETAKPSALSASYSPPWLWPNLLSLDAPLVALLWQLLLARGLAVPLNRFEPLVLVLCVWVVYVADRVCDTLRPVNEAWEPARKTFYRGHLSTASAAALGLLLAVVPLAYCLLRRRTFHAGLLLSVVLLSYFAVIHFLPAQWRARWPRELAMASLFAAGTFLAVWIADSHQHSRLWAPAVLFLILCWMNCSAIETWEWQNTLGVDGEPSRSARWIAGHIPFLGGVIAGLAAVAACLALVPAGFSIAVLLSGSALSCLAAFRYRWPIHVLRVVADLALCTPLLVMLASSLA